MKKTNSKKAQPKKSAPKKSAPKKAAKSTGNKVLDAIMLKIAQAKKEGLKSQVVLTTNRSHYKAKLDVTGFGDSDLKPKVREAYKTIYCKYDVVTKLVNANDLSVDWIVLFKK